jgi:hypothetical protein
MNAPVDCFPEISGLVVDLELALLSLIHIFQFYPEGFEKIGRIQSWESINHRRRSYNKMLSLWRLIDIGFVPRLYFLSILQEPRCHLLVNYSSNLTTCPWPVPVGITNFVDLCVKDLDPIAGRKKFLMPQ